MKNFILTLCFGFASSILFAQNQNTKAADILFDRYEFVDAALAYTKLVDGGKADGYVYKQLADSYFNIFNTKQAIQWYAKAVETDQNAETYYRYAQMLKAEGNYAEADKQMRKFSKLAPSDMRAKAFEKNPNYLPKLKEQIRLFEVEKSDISGDKSDFGAILTNDNQVYFSSARNAARKNSNFNEDPYFDLYKATFSDGKLSMPVEVTELNTKWHDGPASVTADGTTIYFGSESFNEDEYTKVKEKRSKFGKIYLYKATNNNGVWINSKPLPFNNAKYDVRNPSISKDGKTLYFSSNMPGGIGGEDLWKVTVNEDGSYGEPENLGEKFNTPDNDCFPFITEDNVLYFSSNGRQGFGGLDVFKYDFNKDNEPLNLGAPVNTEKDDFAFTYNSNKKIGMLSSNRDGNDDIFMALPICRIQINTIVKDAKTGAVLDQAMVTLLDNKNKTIGNQTTINTGRADFNTECAEKHIINVEKPGYESNTASVSKTNKEEVTVEILLQPIVPVITDKEVILQPIYFDYDKSNITQQGAEELNKLVMVMTEYPEMIIACKSHTDNRGSDAYNFNLSDRRAKSTVQYLISKGIAKERISGNGFGEKEPIETCEKCTEEQHARNRRSEFIIVKK